MYVPFPKALVASGNKKEIGAASLYTNKNLKLSLIEKYKFLTKIKIIQNMIRTAYMLIVWHVHDLPRGTNKHLLPILHIDRYRSSISRCYIGILIYDTFTRIRVPHPTRTYRHCRTWGPLAWKYCCGVGATCGYITGWCPGYEGPICSNHGR